MNCALWLNGRKVLSADEIAENFDIAAIRGYFLGGSLVPWLSEHGGQRYLDALSALASDSPELNNRLAEVFGQRCDAAPQAADGELIKLIDSLPGLRAGSGSYAGSGIYVGSFGGSFSLTSGMYMLLAGSLGYGSYNYGSYNFGSYTRMWQWEWEWLLSGGSFRGGSFTYGSFYFTQGSFYFRYGSFGGYYGRSFSGSFPFMGSFGSFAFPEGYKGFSSDGSFMALTPDEYDAIMYRCLELCPLNRYGYGIHLI